MFNITKFSENLGELIFEEKSNAGKLSAVVGVAKSTICRYLKRERVPEIEILVRIADHFRCTLDFLVGIEENNYGKSFAPCPPFSERFAFLLEHYKVNRAELCRRTGLPESVLYTWKNGEYMPSTESVLKLAEYFKCTADFVMGRGD